MRFKITLITCGLLLISGLAVLVYKRNCYSIVSHIELLTVREKLKALTSQEKKDPVQVRKCFGS